MYGPTHNNKDVSEMVSQFIYSPSDRLSNNFKVSIEQMIQEILLVPLDFFISIVDEGDIEYCHPRHIPQYSNMYSAIGMEVNYLSKNGGKCSLEKIGSILPGQIADSVCARVKYGENHSKLLEIFGLALVQNGYVELTEVGNQFSQLDSTQRQEYVKRSIFRTPIVRNIMIKSKYQIVSVKNELLLFLSNSTANRRLSNVYNLIKWLNDVDQPELAKRMNNIKRQ